MRDGAPLAYQAWSLVHGIPKLANSGQFRASAIKAALRAR